ncbi:MAG: alpha-amylase family glycosyl hydrolase, partial [Bacteroidota bacterium]
TIPFLINAQITTEPALPEANQPVKIIFDATAGNGGLEGYTGDVYAHTGVITENSNSGSDWKYVLAGWTENIDKAKMTRVATDRYELEITPDIRSFYGVPENERIEQMAFVFRSSDSNLEGKTSAGGDIYVEMFEPGLNVSISSPISPALIDLNDTIILNANTSEEAQISIHLGASELKNALGTEISDTLLFDTPGDYWISVTGSTPDTSITDSVFISVLSQQVTQALPAGVRDGINYISDSSVTLVLHAPGKEHVHIIGDMNNWMPQTDFRLNGDQERFWITINGLDPEKEYIWQYLVDGNIRIADPYSEKISDPYDDKYIPEETYPNLIEYPSDKTSGRASVIQTGREEYEWLHTDYTVPKKEELVIYELLIRDFTEARNLDGVMARLDYLQELGVNAIELMPINEFEGNLSWGYNPNFYFAPDKFYGTEEKYKQFIDECHRRGMIVIQDLVLNHAFYSCPLVKLYFDEANNRPASNNPWFNAVSPNPVFYWGADFDHESKATNRFVGRVLEHWLTEYKIDGFRLDFTKGMTNTPGDGSFYDPARIAILNNIADTVWKYNPNAFVILEHFAPDQEERQLVQNDMLVWGNMNYNFNEATMGYHDNSKSDFSRASWQHRGFPKPGLVAYMESHDEERLMYKNQEYGNSMGDYNIKNLPTALDRNAMATAFFLAMPGPKMIWQFGEIGYDYSIDYNDRVGVKPTVWHYLESRDRMDLYDVYRGMIALRDSFEVFTSGTESLDLGDESKILQLSLNDHFITLVGNFGVDELTISVTFQETGTWHEFFSSNTNEFENATMDITLQPGEFRLYSNVDLPDFDTYFTPVGIREYKSEGFSLRIFPNPAGENVSIASAQSIDEIEIFSLSGKKVFHRVFSQDQNERQISLKQLRQGLYFIRCRSGNQIITGKMVKN